MPTDAVREHYSAPDLLDRIVGALRAAGVDPDHLTVDDLGGIDQLHAGFTAATHHLLDVLDLDPSTTLLDVGCGIGGTSRLAAARTGCTVQGIDLSDDFVALARELTRRVGLDHLVRIDAGSATALPYDDASFDRAVLDHVGMNLPDKAAVFAEVRRVLRPGSTFVVYDQMRVGDGDLPFPLPWAEDPAISFVETADRYVEHLTEAGFTVESQEDRTHANLVAMLDAADRGEESILTPAVLFGDGFDERIANNIAATRDGLLQPVLMIARTT